jgi:thiosulfate/3-mercaptopyruvate sulfurtransferase
MEDVTLEEVRSRLDDEGLTLLDVRTSLEFEGAAGAHCDPRQGHIPGAVNLPLERILQCRSADEVRAVVGLETGAEIVAYCHVGSRSGYAVQVLEGAGYRARNYVGSWHEWSREVEEPS